MTKAVTVQSPTPKPRKPTGGMTNQISTQLQICGFGPVLVLVKGPYDDLGVVTASVETCIHGRRT